MTQNGFVESFNGRMRDELLNGKLFFDPDHARLTISAWVTDYNLPRPHSSDQPMPGAGCMHSLDEMVTA